MLLPLIIQRVCTSIFLNLLFCYVSYVNMNITEDTYYYIIRCSCLQFQTYINSCTAFALTSNHISDIFIPIWYLRSYSILQGKFVPFILHLYVLNMYRESNTNLLMCANLHQSSIIMNARGQNGSGQNAYRQKGSGQNAYEQNDHRHYVLGQNA